MVELLGANMCPVLKAVIHLCALQQSAFSLCSRLCTSSMAGEDGRRHRSRTTVAVILVLCALAHSISCFSLPWFFKDVAQDKVVHEATVMEVKDRSIHFNGKKLDSQSGSASAAVTESEGLLHADLDQLDAAGKFLLPCHLII